MVKTDGSSRFTLMKYNEKLRLKLTTMADYNIENYCFNRTPNIAVTENADIPVEIVMEHYSD